MDKNECGFSNIQTNITQTPNFLIKVCYISTSWLDSNRLHVINDYVIRLYQYVTIFSPDYIVKDGYLIIVSLSDIT